MGEKEGERDQAEMESKKMDRRCGRDGEGGKEGRRREENN